jgi:hypothetical protein
MTATEIIRLPDCECLKKTIKISSGKFSIYVYLEKFSETFPSPVTEGFLPETEITKY